MFLRIQLLLICLFTPFGDSCVPVIPPEYDPPTTTGIPMPTTVEPEMTTQSEVTTAGGGGATVATTAEENLCDQCDINEIAPTLDDPDNSIFETIPQDPVDGCLRTYAVCQRTDLVLCDSVEMFATNADGITQIGDFETTTTVGSYLDCGTDGRFKWNTVEGITKLSCDFINCS